MGRHLFEGEHWTATIPQTRTGCREPLSGVQIRVKAVSTKVSPYPDRGPYHAENAGETCLTLVRKG